MALGLVGFPARPAFAVGNIYYIDNVNGGGVTCNNAGSGTSTTAPWCDISQATAHGAFTPGDQILLRAGRTWTGQAMNLTGTGTSANWITLGSYGTGAKPIIQGATTVGGAGPTMRTIDLTDIDYWTIGGLEIRNAAQGIAVTFHSKNHTGLRVTDCFFNGLEEFHSGYSYDVPSAPQGSYGIWSSTSVIVNAAEAPVVPTLSAGEWVLKDIVYDRLVADSATAPAFVTATTLNTGTDNHGSYQDVVIKNSTFKNSHGAQGNYGVKNMRMFSNSFINQGEDYAASGTTAVFFWGSDDVKVYNNNLGLTPHTGSPDETSIDIESYNNNITVQGNLIHNNAGAGIEMLGSNWNVAGVPGGNTNLLIDSNTFINNATFQKSNTVSSLFTSSSSTAQQGTVSNNVWSEETGFNNTTPAYTAGTPHAGYKFVNNRNTGSVYEVSNIASDFYPLPWGAQSRSGLTYTNLTWDSVNNWYGTASGYVATFNSLPPTGSNTAIVRTWTAPKSGTVNIRGVVAKVDTTGDGVVASITRAGAVLWPVSGTPQAISASDLDGAATTLDGLSVTAGDVIRFEVSNGASGNSTGDLTTWLPTVAYDAPQTDINRVSGASYAAYTTNGANVAGNAFDGNPSTYWRPLVDASHPISSQWLEVTYPSTKVINAIYISDYDSRVGSFEIQWWDATSSAWVKAPSPLGGSTTWTGGGEFGSWKILGGPISTTKLRLQFLTSVNTKVSEFVATHIDYNRNSIVASSSNWSGFTAAGAFDDYLPSAWQAASGTGATGERFNNSWLSTDLVVARDVNRAVISEYGNRTSSFKIQYLVGATWTDAYNGTTIGPWKTVTFPTVNAQKWRLLFTGGIAGTTPIVYEFALYRD